MFDLPTSLNTRQEDEQYAQRWMLEAVWLSGKGLDFGQIHICLDYSTRFWCHNFFAESGSIRLCNPFLHRRWSHVRQIAPRMPLCWIWLWWTIVVRICSLFELIVCQRLLAFELHPKLQHDKLTLKEILVCYILNLPRSLAGPQHIQIPPASVCEVRTPTALRYENTYESKWAKQQQNLDTDSSTLFRRWFGIGTWNVVAYASTDNNLCAHKKTRTNCEVVCRFLPSTMQHSQDMFLGSRKP